MNINITGHNMDISSRLRKLTKNHFEKIKRHFDHITTAHVIFSTQKLDYTAEAIVHIPGEEICAKASDDDICQALNNMMVRLDRQVKEHKEKLTSHRNHKSNHLVVDRSK